jgi:ABC-type microcin C transport system permease subunit YejB
MLFNPCDCHLLVRVGRTHAGKQHSFASLEVLLQIFNLEELWGFLRQASMNYFQMRNHLTCYLVLDFSKNSFKASKVLATRTFKLTLRLVLLFFTELRLVFVVVVVLELLLAIEAD